jgi:hypothetical protein
MFPSDIIKIFRLQVFAWHLKDYLSLIYNLGCGSFYEGMLKTKF